MNQDILSALGHYPLLSGLEAGEIESLSAHCVPRRVRAREIIYGPEPADAIYFIHSGRVRLTRIARDGGQIFVRLARSGECIGCESLLLAHPLVQAIALDASSLMVLPHAAVRVSIERSPLLANRLLAQYSRYWEELLARFADVVCYNVPERLARFLLFLAEQYGSPRTDGGVLIDAGLSHQDIASAIGTSRETTTTLLNTFKESRYLDIGRKTITLLNVEGLRSLTSG